jgi:hypothetical protein
MIDVDIQRKFYQKTHACQDGVTQVVDEKIHHMYTLKIVADYFKEDAAEAVQDMINDLKNVTQDLEDQLKERREERER